MTKVEAWDLMCQRITEIRKLKRENDLTWIGINMNSRLSVENFSHYLTIAPIIEKMCRLKVYFIDEYGEFYQTTR